MAIPATPPTLDRVVTTPVVGRSGRSESGTMVAGSRRGFYLNLQTFGMDRNQVSDPTLTPPDLSFDGLGFLLDAIGYTPTVAGIELRITGAISTGTDALQPTWVSLVTLYLTPGVAMTLQAYAIPCSFVHVEVFNTSATDTAQVEYGAWARPQ